MQIRVGKYELLIRYKAALFRPFVVISHITTFAIVIYVHCYTLTITLKCTNVSPASCQLVIYEGV